MYITHFVASHQLNGILIGCKFNNWFFYYIFIIRNHYCN